ncbi:FAD-dependent oxidoreductase [Clostridiales bacterium PH28_bin88]|nr:FAD-dependent oxidoreductase [Clostridiales bacterium PH28_bin88]
MESRDALFEKLKKPWDVIVIGGGITGAGLLREAGRAGLRCLLLEQRDFGWGTSSRSGKLVHGGLRYLKQGQLKTTWHSVREREKLLREYDGLVEPVGFLIPTYGENRLAPLLLRAGLLTYDLIAMKRSRRCYRPMDAVRLAPALKTEGLKSGFWYRDARTDDARLVLRVIREGVRLGGTALNYARVEGLCRDRAGRVRGVAVRDVETGHTLEVMGQVVINATGVWADKVRAHVGKPERLRPLRGSHLAFPRWRFPLPLAVSCTHPEDGRAVYVFSWEDITLVGTTDLDHEYPLDDEPRITPREGSYLLEVVQRYFPSLNLSGNDVISTFSGVRPVVNTGRKDPSKESRDHVIWVDIGLVTVTGGKLTTFGLLARETLASARGWLPAAAGTPCSGRETAAGKDVPTLPGELGRPRRRRLMGRFSPDDAAALVREAGTGELEAVPGTGTLWAEMRWAARHEGVVHLDDLLMRRVRLGILAAGGGMQHLARLRNLVQPALGWDDSRWEDEAARYLNLWQEAYSPTLIN